MMDVVRNIFNTFGPAVFVPVVLFIIAKCMGVTVKKSFNAALLAAVGLTGFNLVIGAYSPIISSVVDKMVHTAGVNLPVMDIGWQATSIVAYSTEVGILFFGVAILLQLALFFTKFTNVFMPSDLWNNYGFMVWGSMAYLITDSLLLAFALMIVQNLYTLLFAELCAKRWSTYYKYPNCCLTVPMHMEAAPFAILMNWLLNKFGLNKIRIEPEALQKKFGILGEPMFLGLILGAIIGLIGNGNALNQLSSWGEISTLAVSTAAIMAIFPKIAGIFASAFTPLTDAYKKKAKESGKGREWYLAVNDAVAYGETSTLMTGILLIPIILIIAFILPGNLTLPIVDLVALPYMVEIFICMTNGNMVKSLICGTIWYSLGLLCTSIVAPYFTEVAAAAGVAIPIAGVMIVSFGVMARPLLALSFLAFITMNPLIIGGVILLYVVSYLLFRKYRVVIVDFLEHFNNLEEEGTGDTKLSS